LRVTFKNDGTADVNLADSIISVQMKNKTVVQFSKPARATGSGDLKLAPGDSVALVYTANAQLDDFPDGAMATLQTAGGYQTSFAVAKP
jgi:hypothetical protein